MWNYFVAGGPVMWPLLALSVCSVAIILERVIFWSRLHWDRELQACKKFLDTGNILARKESLDCSGPLGQMLFAGLNDCGPESGKAMESVALDTLSAMNRGMGILDVIITASPMLGILGTVWGIITAFDIMGASGLADPQGVVGGMAQSLLTTASGLCVALITLFPFNYFQHKVESATIDMENMASRLEIQLARLGKQ